MKKHQKLQNKAMIEFDNYEAQNVIEQIRYLSCIISINCKIFVL